MNSFKLLCLYAGMIGSAMTAYAQEINLKGKVVDIYGDPVKQAKVSLCKQKFSCKTDSTGQFVLYNPFLDINHSPAKSNSYFIGIRKNALELGNLNCAKITVFSMNGAIINNLTVEKQRFVLIDKLIPLSVNSQAVIISISAEKKKINLKAVKCGQMWLWNDHSNPEITHNKSFLTAATAAVDTVIVSKSGMKTASVPVSALVATLKDIVLSNADSPTEGAVTFSEPSKTFKNSFTVTLNTNVSNAEIRYTIDGTLPNSESDLYQKDAISITQTTQLRAAAFVAGTMIGNSSTAIYIARDFDYTSDAPIIIMEGYGKGKPKDKYNFIDLAFMTFEPVNGASSIDNTPTLTTRAGYHLRGQSSMMMFSQAPYRIELWDENNNDTDFAVLSMPSGSDWALISPCTDNSLIRNIFGFEIGKAMGLATVQYRFAEVFINQDGGVLSIDDYEGVYALVQSIKIKKNTLDLKKLKPDDTDPEKLSGGYILKFEWAVKDTDMLLLECKGAKKMSNGTGGGFGGFGEVDTTATCFDGLELAQPSEPNQQQIDWITDYIQQFHDALHTKPFSEWTKYADINSFINLHLLNEISCDVDAWRRSHYFYKDRNELLKAGPVWDYNFAFGNYSSTVSGWHCDQQTTSSNDWHKQLWKNSEFKTELKKRYTDLRKSTLSDESISQIIQNIVKPIKNVGARNFDAWPMGKCSSMGGGWGGGGSSTLKDTTWSGNVDSVKIWTTRRLKNLDSCFTKLP